MTITTRLLQIRKTQLLPLIQARSRKQAGKVLCDVAAASDRRCVPRVFYYVYLHPRPSSCASLSFERYTVLPSVITYVQFSRSASNALSLSWFRRISTKGPTQTRDVRPRLTVRLLLYLPANSPSNHQLHLCTPSLTDMPSVRAHVCAVFTTPRVLLPARLRFSSCAGVYLG